MGRPLWSRTCKLGIRHPQEHGHHVECPPRAESGPIFNFNMGKNTPERKDHIMDKLVVPVDE